MKFSTTTLLLAGGACAAPATENDSSPAAGAVFAMTNVAASNSILSFTRSASGLLTPAGTYPTGGRGQGVDFDTQGGLQLGPDNKYLYAVNPADDLVSVFAVRGANLTLVQTVYAGDQPLSIAVSGTGYAYVLDGSVASTGLFGFRVSARDGTLEPLTNRTIPLSSPIGVPGGVAFAPDGRALVVTNKVGSTLDVFAVDAEGRASASPVTTMASSGERPFAAAFFGSFLYVVESGLPSLSNAALSTYRLNGGGGDTPSLTALTRAARNDQTDGCWVAVTPDGRWAYTANFVSGSISSYALAGNGTASLTNGTAALPGGKGSQPVDLALGGDGRYLYNLLRGSGAVAGYEIQQDGSLKQVGGLFGKGKGLPAMDGASGLAGY
ncbi:lactonase, 7-bladed beta-propeller domain-containing protein [Cordyceps javanica]|uniref:Lactonase, 7-bladed beta-propeller domain-containing protein n=1 Tax=Cordyceps javanica TaxID=43265 RepID=A0A545VK37_9HYPO|nr:lactonase, 7-bladed beta-propeller domain-containing protein [Cordyceps javanica]TQW02097.1 lactonase, 7-bladed beta-propeller domain-containing protein [Cordyceps javanica]